MVKDDLASPEFPVLTACVCQKQQISRVRAVRVGACCPQDRGAVLEFRHKVFKKSGVLFFFSF